MTDLAAEIDREQFDAQFFFLRNGGWVSEKLVAMGFPVMVLGWKNGYSVLGRLRLIRALRAFSPHIIHDHVLPPLTRSLLQFAMPAAYFISSEHGTITTLVGKPKKWFAFMVHRMEYPRIHRIIVHSSWMADLIHGHYHVARSRISLINLGIDLQTINPKRVPDVSSDVNESDYPFTYRIGYLGRIENARKGADYLPMIAQRLRQLGYADFEIVIGGDGQDREATEQLCRQLQVEDKVRFLGWQADVAAFLAGLDLLVVPSRSEAFGLVVLEALAMGVRVVAFEVGGIPEAADGCEDVKLVPADSVAEMVDGIREFKERYGCSRSLRSRSHVERRFDRRIMALAIEKVYLDLIGAIS